jgi:MFS family permease
MSAQLIALRLLIGVFEAGFYPTALFYLSNFYTRFDLAVRIALFYGQYAIAGAFSGAIGKCFSTAGSCLYAEYHQHMEFSI